ncbi:restriction system protein [Rhodococcus sp. SMB37]|nr:restriction system protein [Rhodococcus sp. SMB37]
MTAPVSEMPVWSGFLTPVLEVLMDAQVWRKRDLHTAVEDHLGLTAEQRAEMLPSGQRRADNRIGWALSGLYPAKLVDKPARATFVITDAGRSLLAEHPNGITEKILTTLPEYQDYAPARTASTIDVPQDSHVTVEEEIEPLEQIEGGVGRLHAEVAADLLDRLRNQAPEFLEQSVLDVLVAMGYGGTEGRAARIGGSGDGGVDGVIDQDPLGLERIYVQAKRYAAENPPSTPCRAVPPQSADPRFRRSSVPCTASAPPAASSSPPAPSPSAPASTRRASALASSSSTGSVSRT